MTALYPREDDADRNPNMDTTQWSVVLAAGDEDSNIARSALEALCETYWYPVYFYIRRRVGSADRAQDLTQGFFTTVLEKDYFTDANPERGRFRAFLLTAAKHFVANEWKKEKAKKRGGGHALVSLDFADGESRYTLEPVNHKTAEVLFDEQWAVTLVNRVLEMLRHDFAELGKEPEFHILKQHLAGRVDGASYTETANSLAISEGAARVVVHRMRKQYREMLREEIAQTVSGPDEIDDEIRSLFASLGS